MTYPQMKFRISISTLITVLLISCRSDKGDVPFQVTNSSLFELVKTTAGSGYYKSGDTLAPAGNSPHGPFRLRMNSIAQRVLNSSGELSPGGTFPDSSLIVKEIVNSGPIQYAVMYQNKNSWAWAEFKGNGEVYYSVTSNGASCTPCHSNSVNRDLVRTFDLH
ncbi:MAG: hypothetical protein K0Q95_2928 [Bacteroidota bacterium]|jgi:hypothetical protein|nr:hypothetical protein [Bacteroidota bacterium]